MTTVATFARKNPDKTALIYGHAEHVESYGQLEARSRRIGHVLRQLGLEFGDNVAVYLANDDLFFDIYWACHRTGLYFTPVNWHLQEDEIQYIVDNSDAKLLIAHARFGEIATRVAARAPKLRARVSIGGEIEGFLALEDLLADVPEDAPLGEELEGSVMLYSSGTTGKPKGVRRPLPRVPAGDPSVLAGVVGLVSFFGITESDRYLTPAPLYHAAPIGFTAAMQRIGATAVIMRRFDPEEALRLIETQKITASQWVPTHFRRLTSLPEPTRSKYDVSSLRVAVHAAAPCPIPLKEQMISWWGDAIVEYYAGTEGGGTLIRAQEWLQKKGSVGRHWAGGVVHILDEDGNEITTPGKEGAIYFEAPPDVAARFAYHKDAEKTASTYRGNLFTIGDIGYKDEDGYLFLTDRQSNMIISGGVNIYPQETESHLVMHPKVQDVAVIGVPNEDLGEEVKAVVVPAAGVTPGPDLERELIAFCRDHIAHYKCPRTIDFAAEVPRTETGKMAKRKLREKYWGGHESRIV
ncbi:MAG: acyl-CoA synthetase [Deltaproteobacteria bacterium]|nr:acyl-CoA synthetase [Deltaproteobacteria bacterium]